MPHVTPSLHAFEDHERSVGTFIEVEHLAPAPEGFSVTFRAVRFRPSVRSSPFRSRSPRRGRADRQGPTPAQSDRCRPLCPSCRKKNGPRRQNGPNKIDEPRARSRCGESAFHRSWRSIRVLLRLETVQKRQQRREASRDRIIERPRGGDRRFSSIVSLKNVNPVGRIITRVRLA